MRSDERMYTNHEGGKVRVTVEQMQSSIAPRVPMGRAQKMESELKPKVRRKLKKKGGQASAKGRQGLTKGKYNSTKGHKGARQGQQAKKR